MNLTEHAQRELGLAGLFDKDSDYSGMIADSVLALVKLFASQRHSGASAMLTLDTFDMVARFKPLTPISDLCSDWVHVSDNLWQNKRRSSTFSRNGGETWYDIDDPSLDHGDTW